MRLSLTRDMISGYERLINPRYIGGCCLNDLLVNFAHPCWESLPEFPTGPVRPPMLGIVARTPHYPSPPRYTDSQCHNVLKDYIFTSCVIYRVTTGQNGHNFSSHRVAHLARAIISSGGSYYRIDPIPTGPGTRLDVPRDE